MCNKRLFTKILIVISMLFGLSACEFTMRDLIVVGCDVGELRDAIIQANQHPNEHVIDLANNCDYEIVSGLYNTDKFGVDTGNDGHHGLPAITTPIIIEGDNARIVRLSNNRAPNNAFRFFMITATGELTLNDLILVNGNANIPDQETNGGAIYLYQGTLTLDEARIINNVVKGEGGGIFNYEGTVFIHNSSFEINTAFKGGAIGNWYGTVEIDDKSEFISNVASLNYGGAINSYGGLTITGSRFAGNEAALHGGAIHSSKFTDDPYRLTVDDVVFENNIVHSETEGGGGAIYIGGGIEFTISRSQFRRNQAFEGGAVSNKNGNGSITNTEFDENYGRSSGGAIENSRQSDLVIIVCDVHNNVSGENGGGIYNSGELDVYESNIYTNSTGGFGGGISSTPGGSLTIMLSAIFDNTAQAAAGGIDGGGSFTIINSTISGNQALSAGGILSEGTETRISHSTIVLNTSEVGFGGGLETLGNAYIKNSIIALNEPRDCKISGNFIPLGDNLHRDGTCIGFNIESSPMFYPPRLRDNGGTTLTHALDPDSPAVDAVTDCTTVLSEPVLQDQRGFSRMSPIPGGACDIGAFEVMSDALPPPPPPNMPNPIIFSDETTCHTGPQVDLQVVNRYSAGDTANAIGRNGDATWLAVEKPEGDPGEVWCWVPFDSAQMDFDPMNLPDLGGQSSPGEEAGDCIFTASMNLFCRSGPGSLIYPDIDEFTAGESALVVGISEDGYFYYVLGVNFGKVCTVPANPKYGETEGDCQHLSVLTSPPPPAQEPDQPQDQQPEPTSPSTPLVCKPSLSKDECEQSGGTWKQSVYPPCNCP